MTSEVTKVAWDDLDVGDVIVGDADEGIWWPDWKRTTVISGGTYWKSYASRDPEGDWIWTYKVKDTFGRDREMHLKESDTLLVERAR